MKCQLTGDACRGWEKPPDVDNAPHRRRSLRRRHSERAFTLLEVMIALAIFFMAVFTILESVSQSLRAARILQQNWPDPRSLVAELSLTNKLEEGIVEGDFGDQYPDFTWTREINLVGTNGLFQVDFTIHGVVGRQVRESKASLLLWRPDSPVSAFRRQL